ncbi:MAG TPA: V-type ATP synthase subunit A [Methanofastidiosum sp.]|nr:V-type ATP synthase subunit A [Methanofastidiosum sp.]HOI76020.1 V-type ATP synthase subunit A [Methanofastidiosum sp.]
MENKGTIYRVSGPVVTATNIDAKMNELVRVGKEGLFGEVIEIDYDKTIIQVYEDTSLLKPGDEVTTTGMPLSVDLGPGLLGSIYDGVQRPLPKLSQLMGEYIKRGAEAPGIDREKKWEFFPSKKKGDKVNFGDIIGYVNENEFTKHFIMSPPNISGEIVEILEKGEYTVEEILCRLDNDAVIKMYQRWPVKVPRPFKDKMIPNVPLVTGKRIIDVLFPLAKGGTAAIPGPFGSGKTVTQQQLAKWSDTKVVVYIGCGERGNEMIDVLTEFPKLVDPVTGGPLMNRTVLIANTSNMPVAAREASIYTGITIAEYYRDMGYDVALMADSTSRWAEAMREISSRLEEMPGEEGYPAYLSSRLSSFYERAGIVVTLGGKIGSVTVIGAVSPPGGDFSEPVVQNTLRITKTFWALDSNLSQKRHFPSINWLESYSLYYDSLKEWFESKISVDWDRTRAEAMEILQKEAELQEIVQLVGADALPPDQQFLLEIARMLREIFLQQDSYHEVDEFHSLKRQFSLLNAIIRFSRLGNNAIENGVEIDKIIKLESRAEISKVRYRKDFESKIGSINETMSKEFKLLLGEE